MPVGTQAYVALGTVLLTDLSTFNPIFNEDISSTFSFDETINIDSAHALVFSTGYGGGQAYLQGTIDATPVPIPGALLLFGSGLLGLAGWRRKFRKD